MPQLDPTWFSSQLFWLLVSFVLLYVILSRLVLPPLQEIIARRQATVAGDVGLAQQFKTEAEEARQHYERTLAEARAKAQQLLDEALLVHKGKAEQAGRDIEQQIGKKLAEADKAIAAKKQELMVALTPAAGELAAQIVEKLTQHAPSADKVKTVLSQLSKARG